MEEVNLSKLKEGGGVGVNRQRGEWSDKATLKQPEIGIAGAEKSTVWGLTVAIRSFDGVRWFRHKDKGKCLCINYFRN